MSKKMFTPGSGGGNKPAQASIPDDILPFVQPPTRSVSKPVAYDPLSSIQAPKPTTTPLQRTIPLVVITAFDLDTAEELSKRLEETVHPADMPGKPAQEPLSSRRSPETPSEPSPADITTDIEEPEIIASDHEIAWSSEQPYLSMNIADLSYYISAQQDELVQSVTISLQHEKFILAYLENPIEYLKNFAEYGWDEESDEAAEEFIQWYVSRFRSELEEERELRWSGGVQSDIEYWIRDVTNDERESVIVYDLDAGETLFVRPGDRNSVTLQKIHQKLSEGRNIVVIHNHPNHTGASLADFSAVAWLDAEYLIVVNPDGRQHHHRRIGDTMVALEPIHNPDYVAPADPLETLATDLAYFFQSLREIGNPPERVMRQRERDPRILEQSFQSEAAPIDLNYVRYSEPAAPEDFWQRFFHTIGRNLLRDAYGREAEGVTRAAEASGIFGYDDASHNLRHFLGGSGDPIDDLPVDKMINELPLFRKDIIQNVRDRLVEKFASAEFKAIDVSEDSTTYAFPTDWRFVGSEGKAEADIYGFSEKLLDSGNDSFDLLTANPPEGVEQAVYDWYLALGKFYYSVRVNVNVNDATQDAELIMQIEVQDRYAWYKNEEVGEVNHTMADLELAGHGRNFAISGESNVIEVSFNLKELELGREEPLFDWPEDG